MLTACGDVLDAKVGIIGAEDAALAELDAQPRDAATPLDAAPSLDVADTVRDAQVGERCVQLPDLSLLAARGPSMPLDSDEVRGSMLTGLECSQWDGGTQPRYAFHRLDGELLMRGAGRYNLRWNTPAGSSGSISATGVELAGTSAPCALGELLDTWEAANASSGCTQLAPTEDALYLQLRAGFFLGLGMVDLTLCPGICP